MERRHSSAISGVALVLGGFLNLPFPGSASGTGAVELHRLAAIDYKPVTEGLMKGVRRT